MDKLRKTLDENLDQWVSSVITEKQLLDEGLLDEGVLKTLKDFAIALGTSLASIIKTFTAPVIKFLLLMNQNPSQSLQHLRAHYDSAKLDPGADRHYPDLDDLIKRAKGIRDPQQATEFTKVMANILRTKNINPLDPDSEEAVVQAGEEALKTIQQQDAKNIDNDEGNKYIIPQRGTVN